MKIPAEFDNIRPYAPEELPEVFERLLEDKFLKKLIKKTLPFIPYCLIKKYIKSSKSNLDFQIKVMKPIVHLSWLTATKGCTFDAAAIPDRKARYTFVSNHRDIVLDSAYLSCLLVKNGYETTVEIAIGDNLLIKPWIKDIVRVNKSFIVQRSLSMREMLEASKTMSRYMHFAVTQKKEHLWIAQREGRAKDSNDRTQESVLKMLALGKDGNVIESLKELNIVPLTISYEYDPCDYLKAQEFQQKRDDKTFKKSKADDMKNMATGIKGQKGRVHYACAPCINTWIDELADLPKNEIFPEIARRMDKEIHSRYMIYPGNYVAADLLSGTNAYAANYTAKDKAKFENYLNSRIDLIDLPNKDVPFLRECILKMYANPLYNLEAAKG